MIISFLNQKGGVGKTTLAFNFASYLALNENKVLVIDADPQESIIDLLKLREKELIFDLKQVQDIEDIDNFKSSYDYIVVDSAGVDSDILRKLIFMSDTILTPLRPSILDFQITNNVKNILEGARAMGYNPNWKVVFNFVKKGVVIKDFIKSIMDKNILEEDVLLKSEIYDNVDYQYSFIEGLSILEYKDAKKKTVENFKCFCKEVLGEK